MGQAGTVYWLHADHLGSTSEVSTATASLSGRERYFPYGQVRYSSGTLPTTYNFTGQRLDGTGLLFYGARYYDPLIGRFTQADTLVPQPGNPQSLNRYAYVLNNPLRYTDPTGHYIYEGGYKDDYDPTHHSYTLPNTAGLVGTAVWFLGPEDAEAIYGVATPMRVAMWSVVAVSDQPGALVNQGSLAAAVGLAAAVPRNEGPSSLGGVVAPQGIGADPWEAGAWRQLPLPGFEDITVERNARAENGARGGTYVLRDPVTGEVMRTGRTNDLLRRAAEHRNNPGTENLVFEVDWRTDDLAVQRGREQMLYDQYRAPLNRIRGIDPRNPYRQYYLDAARRYGENIR